MQLLNFNNNGKDLYHTWNQSGGVISVTGWSKNATSITTSTEVELQNLFYSVESVDQVRNHVGVFDNPKDKENTFFKIKIKFKENVSDRQKRLEKEAE